MSGLPDTLPRPTMNRTADAECVHLSRGSSAGCHTSRPHRLPELDVKSGGRRRPRDRREARRSSFRRWLGARPRAPSGTDSRWAQEPHGCAGAWKSPNLIRSAHSFFWGPILRPPKGVSSSFQDVKACLEVRLGLNCHTVNGEGGRRKEGPRPFSSRRKVLGVVWDVLILIKKINYRIRQ
jgi:hypothetical protein